MKGILLVSHGKMAEGIADTCKFIMGDSLTQLESCCLEQGESPEHYGTRLKEKLLSVDTGDGVIVFCDLYGGTPCKEVILQLNEKIDLISGMNFPLVLETMTNRISENIDIDELVSKASNSIVDVKKSIAQMQCQDEDE